MEGQHSPPGADGAGATVQITPTRAGVRIRLPLGGEFAAALAAVDRALVGGAGQVRGAAVTVDAAGRSLSVAELREIETLLLERHGAQLLQVVEGQREPVAPQRRAGRRRRVKSDAARELAAAAEPTAPPPPPVAEAAPQPGSAPAAVPVLSRVRSAVGAPPPAHQTAGPALDMTPTLLVRRTLRSGQRVRFNGNVVVLGDVNPGAEIVASGDIVVMGTLRGVAHAGATGSAEAVVVAFRLHPVQLRVGTVIGRAPDGQTARPDGPEVARLRDGNLVIERFLPQGFDG